MTAAGAGPEPTGTAGPGLQPAPVWLRAVAHLTGLALVLALTSPLALGVRRLNRMWQRRRRGPEVSDREIDEAFARTLAPYLASASALARADRILYPTRGSSAPRLGLRTVDVRTGGPITRRGVLAAEGASALTTWLRKALTGPGINRRADAIREAHVEIERDLGISMKSDPVAVMAAMRERGVDTSGCLPLAMPWLGRPVLALLTVLLTRRHQTPYQWIARSMVVREARR